MAIETSEWGGHRHGIFKAATGSSRWLPVLFQNATDGQRRADDT
jgi:hypothetical protein